MQEDIRPDPLTSIWEVLLKLDQCARRIWGEFVGEPISFAVFLKRNQTYQSICDGFSEPFNGLFVKALDYYHQIDLHLMQQQTGQLDSEELESAQQILSNLLSNCMDYILPHVEETYADEMYEAFDAFKQKHKNDEPVYELLEFQQILEAFLGVVEREKNSAPPPPPPPTFINYLSQAHSRLLTSITCSVMSLSQEDRKILFNLMNSLQRESMRILKGTEQNILDQTAISQRAISQRYMSDSGKEYHSAILQAYTVYRLERCWEAPSSAER